MDNMSEYMIREAALLGMRVQGEVVVIWELRPLAQASACVFPAWVGSPTTYFPYAASRPGGMISSGISGIGQRLKRIITHSKRSLGDAASLAHAVSGVQRAAGSESSQVSTSAWSKKATDGGGGVTPHGQQASYIQQQSSIMHQASVIQLAGGNSPFRSGSPELVGTGVATAAPRSSSGVILDVRATSREEETAATSTALAFVLGGNNEAPAIVMSPFSPCGFHASRRNSMGSVASFETSPPSQAAGSCVALHCAAGAGSAGLVKGMRLRGKGGSGPFSRHRDAGIAYTTPTTHLSGGGQSVRTAGGPSLSWTSDFSLIANVLLPPL